ncbi:CRISPR-associated endoribonuclease Cas6 [Candidatus Caldatribacterium sp.]|uniref:CRISPR-associated endoribonuclease Cas6 n=1 Tax=Candidatus Caldatribacterium sp. TaxID=2282143 RepID=UPI0038493724|nr:CRISPR-associated endoribonuclease Cas6 [Candidatus Caldatribacterium sp.]
MRLRITLWAEKSLLLPWNYQHYLHGFLYAAVTGENPEIGTFLHEQGFAKDHHRYKFFVFSKLFPTRVRSTLQGLFVSPPILWWVASPLSPFVEALALALLKSGRVTLDKVFLYAEKVEIEAPPMFAGQLLCETMSPLVTSTGTRKDTKLHKVFLSPEDPRFSVLVRKNLLRKARAFGIADVSEEHIFFEPVGEWRSKLVTVQGTNVRGYEGRFRMEGDARLLALAYDAGLGERNSQGFGMFRVVETLEEKM